MTPQEIVHELDKHIVGQAEAKRAVADRAAQPLAPSAGRRAAAPGDHAEEHPDDRADRRRQDRDRAAARAARRRAVHQGRGDQVHRGRLRRPRRRHHRPRPGRDRRQADARAGDAQGARARAEDAAEDRILDVLVPPASQRAREPTTSNATRQKFRKKLREGELDDKEIEIEVAAAQPQMEILAPPGMEELTSQIQGMFSNLGGGAQAAAQAEDPRGAAAAHRRGGRAPGERGRAQDAGRWPTSEQNGIVFLDEIDKITSRSEIARRRRVAPGRAARPAAAGRGHHRVDAATAW